MTKKEIVQKIQNYTYYKARLEDIAEQQASICYKTTPTYGNLAPSTSNGFSSKVETYGNKFYELCKKEKELKRKIAEIERLIERSGLDEREKAIMWWIARNGKLQAYARRERIGKDNVYKIRDRALDKIIVAINTRKVV